MITQTAPEFASKLNFAFQKEYPTFYRGVYYSVSLEGETYKIARSRGVGRNAGKWYLHMKKPVTVVLKSETGEVLRTRTEESHKVIELHNARAEWKEIS